MNPPLLRFLTSQRSRSRAQPHAKLCTNAVPIVYDFTVCIASVHTCCLHCLVRVVTYHARIFISYEE